jgi:hypothetical protein
MAENALTTTGYCLIVSTGEQVGEKLNSFRSLNKIETSKDIY